MDQESDVSASDASSVLTDPPATQDMPRISVDEAVQKLQEMEEALKLLDKYDAANEKIKNLRLWLENKFISDKGHRRICKHIVDAESDVDPLKKLLEVEDWLRTNCISTMASRAGKTKPCPTPDSSSFPRDELAAAEDAEAQGRDRAFHINLALRDRLREQITHQVSDTVVRKLIKDDPVQGKATVEKLLGVSYDVYRNTMDQAHTQGCHIVPYHLAKHTQLTSKEKYDLWETLYNVFPEIRDRVSSSKINELCNGFTMTHEFHIRFGDFEFGLEHWYDDVYKVHNFTLDPPVLRPLEKLSGVHIVRFEYAEGTKEEDKVCKHLLRTHLAVGKMFHALGGAEAFESTFEDDGFWRIEASYPMDMHGQELWAQALKERLYTIVIPEPNSENET